MNDALLSGKLPPRLLERLLRWRGTPDRRGRPGDGIDHLVSLVTIEAFMAVGAYYDDFSPVSDAEVVAMLERAQRSPVPGR